MLQEKGNAKTFWGLLDVSSELIVISEDPCYGGSPVKVGVHSSQEINEVLY